MIDALAEAGAIRLDWDQEAGRYVYPSALEAPQQQRRGKQQGRPQGHFLKGPIPMAWLERAYCLSDRAARVAIAIWFVRGLKQAEPFKVKQETLARFGVRHRAVYSRALAELEGAGLIQVTRKPGRSLAMTIVLDEQTPPD